MKEIPFTENSQRSGGASLHSLLGIDVPRDRVISLVGAGGKTTILYYLAHELAALGNRVAVSTTTHIFYPQAQECESVVTDGNPEEIDDALNQKQLVAVGTPAGEGKLSAPGSGVLDYLHSAADCLLIEADGSHRMPVKMPNKTEPVIYPKTDRIVAVAGLSALGKPLGRACHRAALAEELLGAGEESLLSGQDLARMLLHGYRGCDAVVLNQADTAPLREQGAQIAALLLESGIPRVAVTSFSGGRLSGFSVQ